MLEDDVKDRLERIAANLATRYYHLVDRERFEEAVNLFARDGCLAGRTQHFAGRARILEALRGRPDGQVVRHLMANIVSDVLSSSRVDVRYDLTVFVQKPAALEGKPGVPPIANLFDLLTEVRLDGAEWKIATINIQPVFWA